MNKYNLKYLLYSFTLLILSCNQGKTEITNQKVAEKKTSYFKDSTSFTEGTKVFVKPIAQMLVIDSIKNVDGKAQYFINGKIYQAKDLHSLEIKEEYHN
jgi:hypothetical protein